MNFSDGLTWGLLRQAESTTSLQLFLLATDPKHEPFLNAANRAHINSHSVGLPSTRTMIPHSRGHWAQGRVGSISLRRHIAATSVHDLHPNLGSGGSEVLIRGFEAVRESGILPNFRPSVRLPPGRGPVSRNAKVRLAACVPLRRW